MHFNYTPKNNGNSHLMFNLHDAESVSMKNAGKTQRVLKLIAEKFKARAHRCVKAIIVIIILKCNETNYTWL